MEYFFRFEQPWFFVISLLIVCGALFWRWARYKPILFRYSLGSQLVADKKASSHPYAKFLYLFRLFIFLTLAFLTGKPQLVDSRSNIIVEGIDIVLTLDASGSMQLQDYSDDERSRFDIAKDEAIRFIGKRPNDAIGLVIFGKAALCRCPVTMDKKILTQLIENLSLGDIDPDATMLSTALITAINRLKSSSAQSKVIILLTDGEPSPGDVDPQAAIEIARKFGIKIYTIGIGNDKDEMMYHSFYGNILKPKVNAALLKEIARKTGGTFFMAQNDRDMRTIYNTIDRLERTKHESPLYSRYFDIYGWLALVVIVVLLFEQLLASTVWFSI